MSRGFGYDYGGFGGPVRGAGIVEVSRSDLNGMVLRWDVSGPIAARAALNNAPLEYTFLATDIIPVTLYVKRSRAGVTPVVWDVLYELPDFTLGDIAEATASAQANADAAAAANEQTTATYQQTLALYQQIVTLLNTGLPGDQVPIAAAMGTLLLAYASTRPFLPTDGSVPATGWYRNGDAAGFFLIYIN